MIAFGGHDRRVLFVLVTAALCPAIVGGGCPHHQAASASAASAACFAPAPHIRCAYRVHRHALEAFRTPDLIVYRRGLMPQQLNRLLSMLNLQAQHCATRADTLVLRAAATRADDAATRAEDAARCADEAEGYSATERYLIEFGGVKAAELDRLMYAKPFPNLHAKSLDAHIRPCVEFLITEVGMARPSLGKALITCPQLLGVGLASLRSGLDFLYSLGLSRESAAKVVERFPHILKYSVETNLRPSADFIRRELGLSPAELAALVIKEVLIRSLLALPVQKYKY